MGKIQPRSQGLSSSRPLATGGGKKRDPGNKGGKNSQKSQIIKYSQSYDTACQLALKGLRRRTDISYDFRWNASLHANKMFLNGNAIADE